MTIHKDQNWGIREMAGCPLTCSSPGTSCEYPDSKKNFSTVISLTPMVSPPEYNGGKGTMKPKTHKALAPHKRNKVCD